jgi:transcriptional regulator with XRE-family HTH domain
MIAPAIIAEIKHLLAMGNQSQRKIATQMGVSRGTVSGVAAGTRPDYEALRRELEQEEDMLPTGPLERCGSCGGMSYMPCQLCQVREIKADRRRRQLLVRRQIKRLCSRRRLPHIGTSRLTTDESSQAQPHFTSGR